MEIDGKVVLYSIVIALVFLLVLISLGIISFNLGKTPSNSESGNNMPEKCKLPTGQDINSWKEHLGHHDDTKDCLKYFK